MTPRDVPGPGDDEEESYRVFDLLREGNNWSWRCTGCELEWPWRCGSPMPEKLAAGLIEHCCEPA